MAYNKQTWVDYPNLSSPITADRLNHMEDGIEEAYNHGGGGGGVTVGTILPYSGSTIPNGFMLCDGSAISRTTYAELFSIIGTAYGAGDGSTTFNIPDLKGRVGVGIDSNDTDFDTLGETGGSKELQAHTHNIKANINGDSGTYSSVPRVYDNNANNRGERLTTESAGTGDSGNLQPYVVINYIIRVTEAQAGEVASETLPVGSEIDFDGDTVPSGWEQITNPESYSTTEVKTNRTWIDGKPIYRLVVDYTIARSTNAWNAVNTLNNIDKIFIKEVTAFVGNEYYLNVWQTYGFYYNKSDSKLYERHTSNYYEGNHMFIILEYTKTTD